MTKVKIDFSVGDQVKVVFKIPQGAKTKPTPFEGVVISLRGEGESKTFIVRKIASAKVAVEKIFPLNSPLFEKVEVIKRNKVRRAKLYFLRKSKRK